MTTTYSLAMFSHKLLPLMLNDDELALPLSDSANHDWTVRIPAGKTPQDVLQAAADKLGVGTLQFEDYTDQLDAFYVTGRAKPRRRRFAVLMAED